MEGERQALSKTTRPLHLEEGAWGGWGEDPAGLHSPWLGHHGHMSILRLSLLLKLSCKTCGKS